MTYAIDLYGDGTYGGSGTPDPTAIDMDGAIGDAMAFGPAYLTDAGGSIISAPGLYEIPFSVEVMLLDNIGTVVTTLEQSFSRSFNDEVNDTGSGTLSLANTDSDNSLLPLDAMVTFKVYGTRAYSMLIESKNRINFDEDEESAQLTAYTGRGHGSIFERAVMYPSRGTEVEPIESVRTFNWSTPSTVYDDSGWGYASQITNVLYAQYIWPSLALGVPFAEGWIDLTTGVIWASSATVNGAPAGFCYFRKELFILVSGNYYIQGACDNDGEIWIDGQKIFTISGFVSMFNSRLYLTAGWHTVAARCVNMENGIYGPGPAGLIFALYTTDGQGDPLTVIAHTDASWLIVAYPAKPPGMYVGKVLHTVYDEAVARGVENFSDISLMFTPTLDSAGKAWPETVDISTNIGRTYLEFLTELSSTYIDWWMKPGTLELYAWNKGTRNRLSGVTLHAPTDPEDPLSGNLFGQAHTLFG